MADKLIDKTVFSLFEVSRSIQKTIADRYTNTYWIKAEMNKLNHYRHSGHCYPELVEKADGKTIAQLKATLWKDDFLRINQQFLSLLREPLKDGIKILFLAKISFDPLHGLSLRIVDIDPSFTLGDLEREKQETVARMKSENIFDRNKLLHIPLLPKRIAIISVETSKGYADFLEVLQTNPWGYSFFHMLYPSLLQGDKAVPAIISQLHQIRKVIAHFDVVAIIRGGGGDVGLSCYNNYELAKEIAMFPIPVITGIGHATNETVVEMISFSNAITPTKIAGYLLQQFHRVSVPLQKAVEKISGMCSRLMREERQRCLSAAQLFRLVSTNAIQRKQHLLRIRVTAITGHAVYAFKQQEKLLKAMKNGLAKFTFILFGSAEKEVTLARSVVRNEVAHIIRGKQEWITGIEKNVYNMNPIHVLKRGYSITRINGVAVTDAGAVKSGELLSTTLAAGVILSTAVAAQKNQRTMNKAINYTQAFEELQLIVSAIEQGEITVDELSEKVKRAALLIKICKQKLSATEEDVNKILDELDVSSGDGAEIR